MGKSIKSSLQGDSIFADSTTDMDTSVMNGTATAPSLVAWSDAVTDATAAGNAFATPAAFAANGNASANLADGSRTSVMTVSDQAGLQSDTTAPAISVSDGATVEIDGASAQSVTFLGTTGTLVLKDSSGFTGQVSGLAEADALDLADVHYGANTTAAFSGDANGGTLTITDGTHTAQIAMLGDYLGSGWTLSSDGNGGTVVVDPSLYPNGTNTGVSAGVKLTPYNGTLTLSTPGQVVSGLIISNGVQINASNVTLENCIIDISNSGGWNIGVKGGLTGVNIENCEIVGAGLAGPVGTYGIYVQGNSQVTINADNIHDVGQGVVMNDGQITLENTYIHDLNAGSGTHYEDVGYFGAANSGNFSFLMQNNTFINQNNQTAAVFLQNYFGPLNNVTMNNNILVGGDYTIYVDGSAGGGAVSNISITNNHLGAGIYGYTDFAGSSPVFTGNVNDGATLVAATGFKSPIVSLASAPAGNYSSGNTLTLTLYASEAVKVTGTPTLTLNDGGTATYTGGTGTNALTFSYTVAAGQNTSTLAATAVNGTIADLDGHALSTSNLPAIFTGVSVGTSSGPLISSITESPSSGDLNAGKTVTLTLNMNGNVIVNTTGGTPTLTLNDGGIATYTGGTGTNALTFSYTVAAGQNTAGLAATSVNLNSATIKDGSGNAANLSVTGLTQTGPQIDTTTATVSSVAASGTGITAGAGDLTIGNVVTLTVNLSEAVTVNTAGGKPTLTLNDGGIATYTGGSGTNALTFSYTVAAGQNTADLAVTAVNLNSATVKDGAGNAANLTGAVTNPAGTLQIDTTAAVAPIMVSEEIVGNRVVLTGTAVAGNIVSIYEETTLLGTTSSNSDGNWVFVTPSETNGAHTFTATATDSAGNVSALSNAIDPDVGAVPAVNAAPVEVGNQYYLFNSSGSDVAFTYAGAVVTAGNFGSWTPIAAVQTASGYDVAWKMTGADEYTVWVTNSSGNAIGNLTGPVSGTSYALESLESTFNQDLNADGVTGLTTTVIQVDGSTSLTEVANRFYLDGVGGSGPALQYAGAYVTAGEFGSWTPIGAVQTASGYDVAWKMAGANQYTVWVTNSNGNAISNLTGPVSGTSTALESLESTFNQDLNGDGVIGLYAAPGTTLQIGNPLAGIPATIGTGATLELAAADTGSVTFASSKGTLVLDHSSTFSGQIFGFTGNGTLSGSDQIDLKDINFNSVQHTYANGVLTVTDGIDTATLKFNGSYTGANFKFASDGKGGTIVYDPPAPYASTPGSATIETGAMPESAATLPGSVTLSGSSENQLFAQPSTFTGASSGFGANDAIDLPAIAFDAQTTLGYLPNSNSTGGIPPLTEGSHSANIALLSNYMASSFTLASNNNGSTMVATEASQAGNESLLTYSQHT